MKNGRLKISQSQKTWPRYPSPCSPLAARLTLSDEIGAQASEWNMENLIARSASGSPLIETSDRLQASAQERSCALSSDSYPSSSERAAQCMDTSAESAKPSRLVNVVMVLSKT